MLGFVAAGPWIVRTYGYGVFIPAVAASGADRNRGHALAARM